MGFKLGIYWVAIKLKPILKNIFERPMSFILNLSSRINFNQKWASNWVYRDLHTKHPPPTKHPPYLRPKSGFLAPQHYKHPPLNKAKISLKVVLKLVKIEKKSNFAR